MQDLIGRTFGQYQIIERIGGGGMATVYRAVQTSLNRPVAIKILPPSLALDETFRERFRREAKAAASLQHPNIVPVYDFGQENDIFYIIMMLVTGGTLKERIGKLSLPLALRLGGQVADALDFAHSQGVVHRDIKPTNVLMAREDWALLGDFGIARLAEASGLTGTGTGIGTPDYMSPEQAMGRTVDRRADVYSLGIMLFEMVTGRRPFSGGEPFTIMRAHIQDPIPRASSFGINVPPNVEAIIDRATQKEPEARFQSANEMKLAIEAALGASTQGPVPVFDPNATRIVPPPVESTAVANPAGYGSAPLNLGKAPDPVPASSPPPASVRTSAAPGTVLPNTSQPAARSGGGGRWLLWGALGFALIGCLCVGSIFGLGLLGAVGTAGSVTTSTPTTGRPSTPTMVPTPPPNRTPSAVPTPTRPAPTPLPVGPIIFQDNFANNSNGWDLQDDDKARMYFEGGAFHVESRNDQIRVTFPRNNRTVYRDFAYEAEMTKISGPDDENYGIAFRAQGVDGYDFYIRGDGQYELSRYIDALFQLNRSGFDRMIEPTQAAPGIINLGNARNKLRVVVRGPRITVYINDKFIGEVTETKNEARKDGTIGVEAGPGVHVAFHAVRIYSLP